VPPLASLQESEEVYTALLVLYVTSVSEIQTAIDGEKR
jgi:hypothetical protein